MIRNICIYLIGVLTRLAPTTLRWGIADVDIKNPSAEHPETSKVISFMPAVSQNVTLRASSCACLNLDILIGLYLPCDVTICVFDLSKS